MIGRQSPAWAALFVSLCVGCGTPAEEESVRPLAPFSGFLPVGAAEDPFAAHRPEAATCNPDGYGVEDWSGELGFEVDTGLCPYVTAAQPSASAVLAGDRLRLRLWHNRLLASSPGKAHAAIRIGSHTVFEATVDIPADAGVVVEEVELPFEAPRSTPVYFHLHNHGANTWVLLDLDIVR